MDMMTTLKTSVETGVIGQGAPLPEIEALPDWRRRAPAGCGVARHWPTVGFDVEAARVEELSNGKGVIPNTRGRTIRSARRPPRAPNRGDDSCQFGGFGGNAGMPQAQQL